MCTFNNVLLIWKRKRPVELLSVQHIGHGSEGNNNVIVLLGMLVNDGHLHLVPRLRMSRAKPIHTPSWHGQGQFYLLFLPLQIAEITERW
jgi:hypothetical protein